MKKLLIVAFVAVLLPNMLLAQYQIKLSVSGAADSLAYFRASVFDEKNFVPKDTIPLYKGAYTINSKKPIVGGVYYFYFPTTKQKIQFVIDNKDTLQFTLKGHQYLDSMSTNRSKNKGFIDYQRLEKQWSTVDTLYAAELKKGKKFNATQQADFFKEKTKVLVEFRKKALQQLKPTDALWMYYTTLNLMDTTVPNNKKIEERKAFFNKMNITAPKLFFTPVMKDLLLEYLAYYPKQADSLCVGIDSIMAKMDCKNKAYPFVFEAFSRLLKNRTVPNNTEGYTYFIEKYVQNGPCKFLSADEEKKITDELAILKLLKLNDTCLNIILPDTSGNNQNLHETAKAFDYTVLMFYDPTCEHCQVEMPKMDSAVNLLEKQLNKKIGKYAICNAPSTPKADWLKFITDYHLNNQFTHVKMGNDPKIVNTFDAYSSPIFYLIDKESKMIAKKISAATLRKILVTQMQFKK